MSSATGTTASAANTAPSSGKTKKAKKYINCAPCRSHKLKCNRQRPCSGCILRKTQHLCYVDEDEAKPDPNAPPDPMNELRQIRRSVATLEGHYRAVKRRGNNTPSPEPFIFQDLYVEGEHGDAYYLGPTYATTPILNHFQAIELRTSRDTTPQAAPPPLKPLLSHHLLSHLPPKPVLQSLCHAYVDNATWIYSYVDEDELHRKLALYVDEDIIDELTLATFFGVCATVMYYIPWGDKILRHFPEPAMATGDRFAALCTNVLERAQDDFLKSPTIQWLEANLLLAHYYTASKLGAVGERIWTLCHQMLTAAMQIGLHRDPAQWNMSEDEIARRRWAWWNILTFERWHCVLLGRPPSIFNSHFDTQYPMHNSGPPYEELGADNPSLSYLCVFRFTVLLGDILHELHKIKPMSTDVMSHFDTMLVEWQDSWPPDMRLDEYGIAAALSANASDGVRKRGVQCMYLIGLFNVVRFMLNRPTTLPAGATSTHEIEWTHDKVAGAAAKLISLHVRAVPDYMNNSVLTVPGHLSNAPYNLFTACMFYCYQLTYRPNQPGAQHFYSNLADGLSAFSKVREMPVADASYKILSACRPPQPGESETPEARAVRIENIKRITFPYIRLADVSDLESVYPVSEGGGVDGEGIDGMDGVEDEESESPTPGVGGAHEMGLAGESQNHVGGGGGGGALGFNPGVHHHGPGQGQSQGGLMLPPAGPPPNMGMSLGMGGSVGFPPPNGVGHGPGHGGGMPMYNAQRGGPPR